MGILKLLNDADMKMGKNQFSEALALYEKAKSLLIEPIESDPNSLEVLTAIGDIYFVQGDYPDALDHFSKAILCEEGAGNQYVRLRRGQCYFELGNTKNASADLACVYLNEGRSIFEDEDGKYLEFIEPILMKYASNH